MFTYCDIFTCWTTCYPNFNTCCQKLKLVIFGPAIGISIYIQYSLEWGHIHHIVICVAMELSTNTQTIIALPSVMNEANERLFKSCFGMFFFIPKLFIFSTTCTLVDTSDHMTKSWVWIIDGLGPTVLAETAVLVRVYLFNNIKY